MWRELGITNSYTLEASFCGPDFGQYSDLHFNTSMLQEIGHHFCETIIDYCSMDPLALRSLLEEIDLVVNNQLSTQVPVVVPEPIPEVVINGIMNDNPGGLGTIKDEDSNADSDFSGDEVPGA